MSARRETLPWDLQSFGIIPCTDLLIGALLALAAVVCVGRAAYDLPRWRRFSVEGLPTSGTVIRVVDKSTSTIRRRTSKYEHTVQLPDRMTVVPLKFELQLGTQLSLLQDPKDPHSFVLGEPNAGALALARANLGSLEFTLMIAFPPTLALISFLILRSAWRDRHAI